MSEKFSLAIWDLNSEVCLLVEKIVKESIIKCNDDKNFTDYLTYGESLGTLHYREFTAKFLTGLYNDDVCSSNIVATFGASFGFTLIMSQFFEAGDYLFVEDLTFAFITKTASNYGMNVIPVVSDNDGISIEKLEASLLMYQSTRRKISEKKPFSAMIYLLSVCHNPKGTSYSDASCMKIVELARKYNVLVVTDDVYNFFQYGDSIANRLIKFDKINGSPYNHGNVVSNGSFSKVLFPSLRLGWLECSHWIANELEQRGDFISGGGCQTFNQQLCVHILSHPSLNQLLNDVKLCYKNFLETAISFMDDNCPKQIKFTRPECSFFLWIELPKNINSKDLRKACNAKGVDFVEGNKFTSHCDGCYDNYLRLCVTNLNIEELKRQLGIFCQEAKQIIYSQ
ncbi:2-aminoadipate transaminase isoform X1 [Hydra vulgaris]|uniref:2-aminoadipate transaminase isoform X1 n=1 Tax=Hydra vulgaris TaxID=6087 RepID=UPI001F5F7067|nr:2-aminoadipate transaminase isoform X1 [Hydra vulgaris]